MEVNTKTRVRLMRSQRWNWPIWYARQLDRWVNFTERNRWHIRFLEPCTPGVHACREFNGYPCNLRLLWVHQTRSSLIHAYIFLHAAFDARGSRTLTRQETELFHESRFEKPHERLCWKSLQDIDTKNSLQELKNKSSAIFRLSCPRSIKNSRIKIT